MRGKGILITGDFKPQVSVLRDESGKITRGLVIGGTLYQNQALILKFRPGYLKLSPVVGVGIDDLLLDNDLLAFKQLIRKQMEYDDQRVRNVVVNQNGVEIDASY